MLRFAVACLAALLIASPALAVPGLTARPGNATCVAPARISGAGTLSATWISADVGAVAAAGSTQIRSGVYTLRGSGSDIWGTRDEFHFVRRQLTGDGDLVARVASLTNTDAWAKAGVMVRASLGDNSPFALMTLTPGSNGGSFQYRTTTGGSTGPANSADRVSLIPRWIRIARRGNTVTGYTSTNGTAWSQRGTVTLTLPATVYVGLAVTSHADGVLATATFDSVTASVVVPTAAPAAGTVGVIDPFPTSPGFTQPTKLLQAPGDTQRWYVLEKTGRVKVFNSGSPATVLTWLDLSARMNTSSEGGLLGLAFHPQFPATRHVFVVYTTGSPMRLVLARLVLDNALAPATVTEQVLLQVNKPYDNHNGGDLAFGNDGHLYVSVGDGGSAGDPGNNAQSATRLLGKFLRIDVAGVAWPSPGYGIPADNPNAGNPRCGAGSNAAACPEIFALGLRNPWRFSIDGPTGAIWTGDVGQNSREEINVITRGGNFGWRCREGTANYNTAGCATGGYLGPVHEYGHSDGNASVTGGLVYRGTEIEALRGRYVFGDFQSGRIWALRDNGSGGYSAEQLADTAYGISSFGRSLGGEIFFTDYAGGRIYRLAATGQATTDSVPDDLAATGCVDAANPQVPAPGVVGYSVNAPFWSDGAVKERYLALPNGTAITAGPTGDYGFPAGAVLMKTMRLGGAPIETRLLMRHPDGAWAGYTYEWNAAGTQATRVRGGKTRFVSGQDWIYPSEGQCQQCHTGVAGFSLGAETGQFNRDHYYALTGRTANQVETLSAVGMLTGAGNAATWPRLPDPADTLRSLDERARSYLHTNCANCHQPGGPTPSAMDLRYATPLNLAATRTCNAPPQSGNLGISNAMLLAPGDPSRSILLQRITRRDAHAMPPLGSSVADAAGAALLREWILRIPACESGSCHQAH